MRLAGHREPREKVVLDAAQEIVIGKKGRSGRCLGGNRKLRKRRLIALSGHLEHKIRSPASLKEGFRSSRLLGEGSALRGPGQRDTDLHGCTQLRYLRMLKELRANSQVGTDSHKAWPKAEPSHVPLHKGARNWQPSVSQRRKTAKLLGPGSPAASAMCTVPRALPQQVQQPGCGPKDLFMPAKARTGL